MENTDKNIIVTGNFQSGKTINVIMPLVEKMITKNKNLLIVDKNYEYFNHYYKKLKEQNYEIKVLNFDNTTRSNSTNLLKTPYDYYKSSNKDKAYKMVSEIVECLFKTDVNSDPFWSETATSLTRGYILKLFELTKPKEINFLSVSQFIDILENDNLKPVLEYFLKTGNDAGYRDLITTLSAPNDTRLSILTVIRNSINNIVNYENKLNVISNNEFDLKEFCKTSNNPSAKRKALFIVPSLEDKNYLANMVLAETYNLCMHENWYFILDSFELLPQINNFSNMFLNSIYHGTTIILGIRNLEKLINMYGEDIKEVASITETTKAKENITSPSFNNDKNLPTLKPQAIKTFDILKAISESKK